MTKLKTLSKPNSVYGIDGIEPNALEQFIDCMHPEFSVAGAAMPDMHLGYTMPIGGVILTDENTIVPSWVGYDIGCGVFSIETSFRVVDIRDNAKAIFDAIYRRIPVGYKHNAHPQDTGLLMERPVSDWMKKNFIERGGAKQLGTLGGGNHFIEIGYGYNNHVHISIHSGSRGIGHDTASHYMRYAAELATGKPKLIEGSFPLRRDSREGVDYHLDMDFCLAFALMNRKRIAQQVIQALHDVDVGGAGAWNDYINRNHNHAEFRTTPFGKGWIHRKGATHAEQGMLGVIPGNMRDGVFIVEGRGCPDSLYSSSHGAGRIGSRVGAGLKKAPMVERLQALDTFRVQMEGVQAKIELDTLDENPMAYKPIGRVLEDQRDLCSIEDHITPIINIKA